MTANMSGVLVVVVCFFTVTKHVITRSFEITKMIHFK